MNSVLADCSQLTAIPFCKSKCRFRMPLPAPPFPSSTHSVGTPLGSHVSYPCQSLPPLVCGTRSKPANNAVFSLRHPRPAPDRRITPSGLSGSQETSACCAQERLRRVNRHFILQKGLMTVVPVKQVVRVDVAVGERAMIVDVFVDQINPQKKLLVSEDLVGTPDPLNGVLL